MCKREPKIWYDAIEEVFVRITFQSITDIIFNHLYETVNHGELGEARCSALDGTAHSSLNDTINDYYCRDRFRNSAFSKKTWKTFDTLNHLLRKLQTSFKVIAIIETRINDTILSNNFNIPEYSLYINKTESAAGGTALYILNSMNPKPRNDLSTLIIEPKLLESTFTEISYKNLKIIVGCIYKHPGLATTKFTNEYLHLIIEKVSREKKKLVLLGDYNIDLLKYDKCETLH